MTMSTKGEHLATPLSRYHWFGADTGNHIAPMSFYKVSGLPKRLGAKDAIELIRKHFVKKLGRFCKILSSLVIVVNILLMASISQ